MERLIKLFDLRGTKASYLLLSVAFNIGFILVFFEFVDRLVESSGGELSGIDTTLMLGIFIGSLAIAFGIFWITKDGRGITYALYGGLAGLIITVLITWKSGLLAALLGMTALLGAYNGGSLGEGLRSSRVKRR